MNFVLKKVNGCEVDGATHDEAVRLFRTAPEPIVVEVLRNASDTLIDTASQTDSQADCSCTSQVASPPPTQPPRRVTCESSSQTDPSLSQVSGYNCALVSCDCTDTPFNCPHVPYDCSETGRFAQTDPYYSSYDPVLDTELLEVHIERLWPTEPLGITLCYGSALSAPALADVYIQQIDETGAAARDGQLQEGDQVLSVNGVDLLHQDKVSRLLEQAQGDMVLLVSRLTYYEYTDDSDDSGSCWEPESVRLQQVDEETESEGTGRSGGWHSQDKDSGVGQTDNSTRHDSESSEQDMTELECESELKLRPCRLQLPPPPPHSPALPDDLPSPVSTDDPLKDMTIEDELEALARQVHQIQVDCSSLHPSHPSAGLQTSPPGSRPSSPVSSSAPTSPTSPARPTSPQLSSSDSPLTSPQPTSTSSTSVSPHTSTQHLTSSPDLFTSPTKVTFAPSLSNTSLSSHSQSNSSTSQRVTTNSSIQTTTSHQQRTMASQSIYDKVQLRNSCKQSGTTRPSSSTDRPSSSTDKPSPSPDNSCPTGSPRLTDWSSAAEKMERYRRQARHRPGLVRRGSLQSCASSVFSVTESVVNNPTLLELSDSCADFCVDVERRRKKKSRRSSSSQASSGVDCADTSVAEPSPQSMEDIYSRFTDIMYTNPENLAHTIALQQRLFQQALVAHAKQKKQSSLSLAKTDTSVSRSCIAQNGETTSCMDSASSVSTRRHRRSKTVGDKEKMEWVLKRRGDGTRYVTRRPVRAALLQQRAKVVEQQRKGTTTDEDGASEVQRRHHRRRATRPPRAGDRQLRPGSRGQRTSPVKPRTSPVKPHISPVKQNCSPVYDALFSVTTV